MGPNADPNANEAEAIQALYRTEEDGRSPADTKAKKYHVHIHNTHNPYIFTYITTYEKHSLNASTNGHRPPTAD